MLAKIKNNVVVQFPYTIHDLFNDNRNVSFPKGIEQDEALLKEFDVYIVAQQARPEESIDKVIEEGSIELVSGSWVKTWAVRDATEEEIGKKIQEIEGSALARRYKELANTDWTQLPDVNLTAEKKQEFAVYRQALRDITTQPGYPQTINWPEKPVI